MEQSLLTIMIPTYSRKECALKNILMVDQYISNLKLDSIVDILVSDNNSLDNTYDYIKEHTKNINSKLYLYKQECHKRMDRNFHFCLSSANGKYGMFLSDDDYISQEYLQETIQCLSFGNEVTCIIGNYYYVDKSGNKCSNPFHAVAENKTYSKGHDAIKQNIHKLNQMTGIVVLRSGLIEAYDKAGVDSIYPQVFCANFNMLRGNTIHITKYPSQVTVGQKKHWNYGDDGLLDNIFNNIKSTYPKPEDGFHRLEAEISFLVPKHMWRICMYFDKDNPHYRPHHNYSKFLDSIQKSKNISLSCKFLIKFFFYLEFYKKHPIEQYFESPWGYWLILISI